MVPPPRGIVARKSMYASKEWEYGVGPIDPKDALVVVVGSPCQGKDKEHGVRLANGRLSTVASVSAWEDDFHIAIRSRLLQISR